MARPTPRLVHHRREPNRQQLIHNLRHFPLSRRRKGHNSSASHLLWAGGDSFFIDVQVHRVLNADTTGSEVLAQLRWLNVTTVGSFTSQTRAGEQRMAELVDITGRPDGCVKTDCSSIQANTDDQLTR